jgi:hypothetical protein
MGVLCDVCRQPPDIWLQSTAGEPQPQRSLIFLASHIDLAAFTHLRPVFLLSKRISDHRALHQNIAFDICMPSFRLQGH